MKNLFLLAFLILFSAASHCSACDVNLVTILTGDKPSDVFGKMVAKLASETRSVGQYFNDAQKSQESLKSLMSTWIDFDNLFSQNPPEWAKKDPNWTKKLKEMADLVGVLQRNLKEKNEGQLHNSVLSLFRKIALLFETMPMSVLQKSLVKVSSGFATVFESIEAKNAEIFRAAVASLGPDLEAVKKILPETQKKVFDDVIFQVDQLQKMTSAFPATITIPMIFSANLAEDDFRIGNQKLLEAQKK